MSKEGQELINRVGNMERNGTRTGRYTCNDRVKGVQYTFPTT